jgi:hypothetical protein
MASAPEDAREGEGWLLDGGGEEDDGWAWATRTVRQRSRRMGTGTDWTGGHEKELWGSTGGKDAGEKLCGRLSARFLTQGARGRASCFARMQAESGGLPTTVGGRLMMTGEGEVGRSFGSRGGPPQTGKKGAMIRP